MDKTNRIILYFLPLIFVVLVFIALFIEKKMPKFKWIAYILVILGMGVLGYAAYLAIDDTNKHHT